MPSNTLAPQKDILGYKLIERIGSGGFGEVWSAVAPGGLTKALKVVYGFHDEKHAQAELKALDRVKELRHPFLLSLERIEIYEGQLVVVTELADNSLADVFNEYIIRGEAGIPRDKLIRYTKSASEALDYISEEHGLQHLDIKPENLLMVSGHVKVADFGLIKDLQNSAQSLMSGMTPAYAAPELFDGRPGPMSDQYSLAIVYQEMLTGVKPFPGTTPAQLAAQHVHGRPNLRPLDKHDQVVIAKALNKDPANRFQNCCEMVEELSNKKRAVKKAIRRTQNVRDDQEGIYKLNNTQAGTALISESNLPFQASEIKILDAPFVDPDQSVCRPTLVVAIGSTANRVAQKLKRHLVSRHGSMSAIPAIRLLCIDVDRKDLVSLQRHDGPEMLMPHEVLETPLRKPEDYRERSKTHLTWLSRRWIYNIPRTLQTEGLRPLGRLAFADHFETICNKLQEAISSICTEEAIATSSDTLELNPGKVDPRVFLLTSISGGVGSGMGIDIAYTIKLLLHEAGLPRESLTGLFLHSTYQRTRDPGISAANALAFLTELRHFIENGYPGDETIGMPEFGDESPIDQLYFNDIGSDLKNSEFEQRLDKIAEYVYLSSCSKCSEFFDKCRSLNDEIDHLALRTFGMSVSGPQKCESGKHAVDAIGLGLIRRWLQGDASVEFDSMRQAKTMMASLEIEPAAISKKVADLAHSIFNDSFEAIIDSSRDICLNHSSDRGSQLAAYIDGVLGNSEEVNCVPETVVQMGELIDENTSAHGDRLRGRLMEMLGGNQLQLFELIECASAIKTRIEKTTTQFQGQIDEHFQSAHQSAQILRDLDISSGHVDAKDKEVFEVALAEYCNRRFLAFTSTYSRQYYSALAQTVSSILTVATQYKDQLGQLANQFKVEDVTAFVEPSTFDMNLHLNEWITEDSHDHIDRTEVQVFESLIKENGGFIGFLSQTSLVQDHLVEAIRMSARNVLTDAYCKLSLDDVVAQTALNPKDLVGWLNEQIHESQPKLNDCGGAARMMIGLPSQAPDSFLPTSLEQQFGIKGCSIKGTNGNFVLCFEGEDVPLANVAYRLLESRPDAIELVKRIHTRSDIDWTSLNELF